MFWDKSYTPSQNIEALLEKENATVEEFLDDDDILLECRSQKKAIVNYFTRPDVIKRLVELITTEPPEDLPMAQRYRHANMACEILTFGLPSLDEKLLSDENILKTFYSYLENEPPLNPLLSSFFSKTFSMLFTKKAEQDWFLYQQMCLKFLQYIKSQNNFLDFICKHFSTPVIPDLIMQMMRDVEGGQMKRSLYEWLSEDKLVERLIAIIGKSQDTDKHANVADFLCDLIQQGRTMRYLDQDNESFEPTFEGSNPILKRIEDEANIEALLNVILEPNACESAIVSGISVVLMLLKPVVFTEEPSSDRMKFIQNREQEIREQILSTVIRVIAPRLKDFNELLRNPPNKPDIVTTAAKLSQPFGITRLQICRFFTVLLQTKNEEILKAVCETDFFETLLMLFKQYCWNNFLHSEVEKCLQLVFYTKLSNNNNNNNNNLWQGSSSTNDGTFNNKFGNNVENTYTFFDMVFKSNNNNKIGDNIEATATTTTTNESESDNVNKDMDIIKTDEDEEKEDVEMKMDDEENQSKNEANKTENNETATQANAMDTDVVMTIEKPLDNEMKSSEAAEENNARNGDAGAGTGKGDGGEGEGEGDSELSNKTKNHTADSAPSAIQKHLIEKCKLISKLIDCWKHNADTESAEKGRRLGYMGHLIKIFKHITDSISESEHIGALIECNLSDEFELKLWQSIINPTDGDLTKALATQNKMLANCNAHEAGDYSQHLPKDFLGDNSTWDYLMSTNMINNLGFSDSGSNDIVFALEHDIYRNNMLDNDDNAENDLNLFQYGGNIDDDDDDDNNDNGNDNNPGGGSGSGSGSGGGGGDGSGDDTNIGGGSGSGIGSSLFGKSAVSTTALQAFGVTNNPWDHMDPFTDLTANSNSTPWAADFSSDNFADFDSHFSSFTNDLGESLVSAASTTTTPPTTTAEQQTAAAAATTLSKENSNNDNDDGNNEDSKNDGSGGGDANQQKQQPTTDNGTVLSTNDERISNAPIATTTTTTNDAAADTSAMGYDNNANVEKNVTSLVTQEIGEFADGTSAADDLVVGVGLGVGVDVDVDLSSNEKALANSLVRTLQSVMQDSEDDYEDDEGMWTKPLGGSAALDNDKDDDDDDGVLTPRTNDIMHFTNGPSSKDIHENENIHKVNKTDDVDSNTIATAHINDSEKLKSATVSGTSKQRTNSSKSLDAINNDVGGEGATAAATTTTTAASSIAVEIAPTTT